MEKGKLGAYAMKRVAAGAHLPTPWFLSLRDVQTIEPTTESMVGGNLNWLVGGALCGSAHDPYVRMRTPKING